MHHDLYFAQVMFGDPPPREGLRVPLGHQLILTTPSGRTDNLEGRKDRQLLHFRQTQTPRNCQRIHQVSYDRGSIALENPEKRLHPGILVAASIDNCVEILDRQILDVGDRYEPLIAAIRLHTPCRVSPTL